MSKYKLIAPSEYFKLSIDQKELICNGCGTAGWKGNLVPDTMWFLRVTEACQIHDYMYFMGLTRKDKEDADETFLHNLNMIIRHCPWYLLPVVNPLRRVRANTYFLAVKHFGESAFLEGKHGFKNPKPIKKTDIDWNQFKI